MGNLSECTVCGIDYHIESELKRHMELRHSVLDSIDKDVEVNKDEMSLEEKLLAHDDDSEFVAPETGSLDEFVMDSSQVEGGVEVELDGNSLSMEDIDFDIDQSNEGAEKEQSDEPTGYVEEAAEESIEFEFPVAEAVNDDVSAEVGIPVDLPEHGSTEESLEFDGESIVMDDAAFDLLENAMQMTMSTPDSDDEEDVSLSSRKRMNISKVSKKRGRPSKKSKLKDEGEILLDGEAVMEDLDSSATDEDILVVDEVNIVQKEESSTEESESEDDDPDFTPNKSISKRENSKRDLRSRPSSSRKKKSASSVKPIQITPVVSEKAIGGGRTKISILSEAVSVPILKSIPKSTRIVFNSGNSKTSGTDNQRSSELKLGNTSAKRLQCSLCKNEFITREAFNIHMLKKHKKAVPNNSIVGLKRNIKCEKCTRTFEKKTLLDDHVKEAHSHKCAKCRQKFDSQGSLNSHMRSHMIKCDKCNFAGDSKLKVLDHKKVAHNFKCSKCRQAFDQKDRLEAHIRANHFFKCVKCNVTFDAKNLIDDHNKRNHYFPCGSCSKVFDMRQRLSTHDKADHQSCDVCEDEFSWAEPGHACYYTKNNIRPVVK